MLLTLLRRARGAYCGRSMLLAGQQVPILPTTTRVLQNRNFAFKIKKIVPESDGSGSGSGGGAGSSSNWFDGIGQILACNFVGFSFWLNEPFLDDSLARLKKFLSDNVVVSYKSVVVRQTVLPIVLHMFSHSNWIEMIIYTYTIANMRSTCQAMGSRSFKRLYVLSGITGGIFHIFSPFFVPDKWPSGGDHNRYVMLATPHDGAISCIAGVWTYEALLMRQPFTVFVASFMSAESVYRLYSGPQYDLVRPGNLTWVGGAVCGAAFFFLSRGRRL